MYIHVNNCTCDPACTQCTSIHKYVKSECIFTRDIYMRVCLYARICLFLFVSAYMCAYHITQCARYYLI